MMSLTVWCTVDWLSRLDVDRSHYSSLNGRSFKDDSLGRHTSEDASQSNLEEGDHGFVDCSPDRSLRPSAISDVPRLELVLYVA